jgi:adenylate cyclase class IV
LPRNLELKCSIGSLAAAEKTAHAIGAEDHGVLVQEDTYFTVPHGRLKIRSHEAGSTELIAYDRPDDEGERWSDYRRIDITSVPGVKDALSITLGVSCVVKKRRHLFLVRDARIHLDEVEGLGAFLEFEVTNEERSKAQTLMAQLCASFGVGPGQGIGGSYADLVSGS